MKLKIILSLLFAGSLMSISAQNKWTVSNLQISNCFLSFPQKPSYSHSKFHGWKATDQNGQVTYLMSYIRIPSNAAMSIGDVKQYLLPSMFKGDIEISSEGLSYCGFSSIDFFYKSTDVPILYKKGRVVLRKKQLYVLQVLFYHEDLANCNQFVKSLKFY